MTNYYDPLETRDPELREREQFAALQIQIANAQRHAPYFARVVSGIDPADIKDRAALSKLPVTRKSDFTELQKNDPPFAGMIARPFGELSRVFMSPGPVFDPEGRRGPHRGVERDA